MSWWDTTFQSHAGSIEARGRLPEEDVGQRGFNPTLVRLRPSRWIHQGLIRVIVSIPRWFD